MLAALQPPAGDGGVAQYHHAQKGGRGPLLGLCAGQERRALGSGTSGQQPWLGYGLMQHRVEELKPLIRIRLRHPKELALHCLNGVLFQISQNKKPLVSHRG